MDEEEVTSVPLEVRERPVIMRLKQAWEGYCSGVSTDSLHERYHRAQEMARELGYSSDDVEVGPFIFYVINE